MTMIDALEPCPDCGSHHHKSCRTINARQKAEHKLNLELQKLLLRKKAMPPMNKPNAPGEGKPVISGAVITKPANEPESVERTARIIWGRYAGFPVASAADRREFEFLVDVLQRLERASWTKGLKESQAAVPVSESKTGEGSELPALETDLERTLASGIGSCITITAADEAEGERVVVGWEEVNVKQFAKRWVARAEARHRLADEAIEVLRTLRGLDIDAEVKAIRRAQAAEYELAALKAADSSPQQESAEDAWERGYVAGRGDGEIRKSPGKTYLIPHYVAPPVTAEGTNE